jgi:hypothetical protein
MRPSDTIGPFMKLPVWTKPAAYGAVAGAVALAAIGFTWGGWTTAGAASDLARKQSVAAIVEVLTPYCLERAASDPNAVALMAEFTASGSNRLAVVEKAGWATPLGAETPHRELARACQLALASQ